MGDAVRSPVAELVSLGPVPGAAQQDTDPHAERRESLGEELRRAGTASDDDARALVALLPPDDGDAYGVVWTLLHVIESAPGWPLEDVLGTGGGPWVQLLERRAANGSARVVSAARDDLGTR